MTRAEGRTIEQLLATPIRSIKQLAELFMPDCNPWSRWVTRGFVLEPKLEGVDILLADAAFYSADEPPGRDLSKIGHSLFLAPSKRYPHRQRTAHFPSFPGGEGI
jgi:hypothetical protein